MKAPASFTAVIAAAFALAWGAAAAAQTPTPAAPAASPTTAAVANNPEAPQPPRFGLGAQISTLGPGVEFAVRVAPALNLRAGFSDFNFSHSLNHDGINYAGSLGLRSLALHADWFIWGPLHISPGLLLYDGNKVSGTASVPAGAQFTLGSTTYTSSASAPVTGTALLNANKTAPMFTVGLGNLVPRKGGHFGISLEVGAAYQGSPQVALALNGTVCDSTGANCQPTSASSVQQNVTAEEQNLNSKLSPFKWYPVLSAGLHYAF